MRLSLLMLGVYSSGMMILFGCDGGKVSSPSSNPTNQSGSSSNALDDDESGRKSKESKQRAADSDISTEEDAIRIGNFEAGPEMDVPLFEATYGLTVVADLFGGVDVCKGDVSLVINKDFSFSLPNSKISCVGGRCELDLDAVMKSVQKGSNANDGVNGLVKGATSDKKFLSIGQIGNYQFTPPRPLMLLSPFHFDPIEDATRVDESYQGSVRDVKSGATSSGSLRLKVEEANQERVRWTMTSTGWDGIARPRAGILTRLDMTWSLNPIGVPHIAAFTVVGDLLSARQQSGESMSSQELVNLCSGGSASAMGSAGASAGGGGLAGGFMSTLVELGARLFGDVMVGVNLDLKSQKVLGKVQERNP